MPGSGIGLHRDYVDRLPTRSRKGYGENDGPGGHLLIMDIEILLSRHTEDSAYALVLQSGYE